MRLVERRRRGRPRQKWEDSLKRFGGSGRGVENETEGVETGGGDSSETGSVMEEDKQIDDWYRCQPHLDFRYKEER